MRLLRMLTSILVVGVAVGAGPSLAEAGGKHFTTLNAPHAGTGRGQGTMLNGINQRGDIVGDYFDKNGQSYGFLLHQGKYTILAYPGAQATQAAAINNQGDVVGYYVANSVARGFLFHQGKYTSIDGPKPGSKGGTFANGINGRGDIVGQYFDSKHVSHGFLWHQGKYTTIDNPKAGATASWMGTYPMSINQAGDIVGSYVVSSGPGHVTGARHGFLWHKGHFTTLDAPGAATPKGTFAGTVAAGINGMGDIVGAYFDSRMVLHGFVLHQGGYTMVDHPKAGFLPSSGAAQMGTWFGGINERGNIVGYYIDSKGVSHGFLWH